jgi:hypothetical protein
MKLVLDAIRASRSYSPNHFEILARFETYVKGFEKARISAGGVLFSGGHLEPETFKELATFFRDVTAASQEVHRLTHSAEDQSGWVVGLQT